MSGFPGVYMCSSCVMYWYFIQFMRGSFYKLDHTGCHRAWIGRASLCTISLMVSVVLCAEGGLIRFKCVSSLQSSMETQESPSQANP